MYRTLIHTHGDLICVMGVDGRVRGYEVTAAGALEEVDPATAITLRSDRDTPPGGDHDTREPTP